MTNKLCVSGTCMQIAGTPGSHWRSAMQVEFLSRANGLAIFRFP